MEGVIKISDECLKRALHIPENWSLAGIVFNPSSQAVELRVSSRNLPVGVGAEIIGGLFTSDDGLIMGAKWTPARLPPPNDFLDAEIERVLSEKDRNG